MDQREPSTPAKPKASRPLQLTQWRFALWWLRLLVLHLLCLAYFVGVAVAYRSLPNTTLAFQFQAYAIGIPESEFSKIATIHEAIAAVHAFFILLMVVASLEAKRLAFYPTWKPHWRKLQVTLLAKSRPWRRQITNGDSAASQHSSPRHLSRRMSLTRVSSALFGSDGLLGVDSMYFDHLLLARELVETSLQTYQAYRMTQVLPRFWLIRAYVALLVANCWIVPALHRVYKQRHRHRRMMSLVCDVVLDLFSSIGISLSIFAIYAPQYTDPLDGFPFSNWYNDKWFINLYQEFQMMIVVSWTDMASRLVFAVGVLQCMESIKELLSATNDSKPSIPREVAIVPVGTVPAKQELKPKPGSRLARAVHLVLHVVGPACFIVWGFVILVIHIYAETQHSDLPCKLPLRSWLTTAPACSLVEVDCHHSNTWDSVGNEAWTALHPALAAGLVIRHCPDLTVPQSMQSFTGLISLKTYNATIVSWPETAGLTAASQPRLRTLYMIRTNLTHATLPPGLMRMDFPSTFRSVFVSVSNLNALPETLDRMWPSHMTISIEFSGLTSVPDVLMRLLPETISVSNNPITSLPPELFEIPTLSNLLLSHTAIQELPRNVTNLDDSLMAVVLESTNVSAFWAWMDPYFERSFDVRAASIAANTPFCTERDGIVTGARTQFSASATETDVSVVMDVSTPIKLAYSEEAVSCSSELTMLFPLDVVDATSELRL